MKNIPPTSTHAFRSAIDTVDRLIDTREVCALRCRGRTDLFHAIKEGRFPEPLRLGHRANRWRLGDALDAIRAEVEQAKAEHAQRTAVAQDSAARAVATRRARRAQGAVAPAAKVARLASGEVA